MFGPFKITFLSAFVALAVLVGMVAAYPYQARYKDMDTTVDCHKFPAVISYHVHVTYMLTNEDQIAEVSAFREATEKHFAPFLGEDPVCQGTAKDSSGRYDNGRICMIYDHNLTNDTLGPFAVGEWSMFVPVHYYGAVVPWFVNHRGQFTLLVHPNTGCEYEDHSIWAQWSGAPWNMDMSIFTPWTQTEEFGQSIGTPENPSCLAQGGVCAFGDPSAPGYGPQVLCCSGSACQCDAQSTECVCK